MTDSEGGEEGAPPEPEAFAWALVMGLGTLGLAAGIALGPALGGLLAPAPLETWPDDAVRALISPEPTELARFTIAVVVPLLAVAVLIFARTPQTGLWASRPVRFAPAAGTLIVLGVLAIGWLARSEPQSFGLDPHYFGERDLAVALLVAAAILFVALRPLDAQPVSRLRSALLRPDSTSRRTVLVAGSRRGWDDSDLHAARGLQRRKPAGCNARDAPPFAIYLRRFRRIRQRRHTVSRLRKSVLEPASLGGPSDARGFRLLTGRFHHADGFALVAFLARSLARARADGPQRGRRATALPPRPGAQPAPHHGDR